MWLTRAQKDLLASARQQADGYFIKLTDRRRVKTAEHLDEIGLLFWVSPSICQLTDLGMRYIQGMSTRLLRSDGRVCARGEADYSLCGDAIEGDEFNDLAPVIEERIVGVITCPMCCSVINNVRENYRGVATRPQED